MARRRVEIKPIEDKSKRHTTFTKRRQGLTKKTKVFTSDFEAEAAVITFSNAGNLFAFGTPSVESLVSRYLAETSDELAVSNGGGIEETAASNGGGIEEKTTAALTEAEKRIGEAVQSGRWDVAVGDLGLEELDELAAEMEKIKCMVAARAKEIVAEGKNGPGDGFSGAGSI